MQRGDFSILGRHDVAYLDNAATSLLLDEAQESMAAFEHESRANVARGIYPWAEQATAACERTRQEIAASLGAQASEIVFTAGATAGLSYVARLAAQLLQPGQKVLLTELEHHSNIVPWQISHHGQITCAACDGDGQLPLARIEEILKAEDVGIVSVTHASNVTGAVVDVAAIAQLARAHGALLAVDGAQYVPHSWPDLAKLGADFYVFSAHKCNGPMGLGVLWIKQEIQERVQPVEGGGGTVLRVEAHASTYVPGPQRHEAGTPNIPAIIGLGAAWRSRQRALDDGSWTAMRERLDGWTARIRQALAEDDGAEQVTAAPAGDGVPLVAFNLKGCHAHDVCQLLADRGVYVRGGHHCAQLLQRRLGIDASVRASLGPHVNEADIDRLLEAIPAVRRTLAP